MDVAGQAENRMIVSKKREIGIFVTVVVPLAHLLCAGMCSVNDSVGEARTGMVRQTR